MFERTRDATSGASSSPLPLEILLPVGVSIVVFLALTAALVHRICRNHDSQAKRLACSPSLLVFSDREANRRWLDGLEDVKEIGVGLEQLRNGKRGYSVDVEVKCRGEGNFENEMPLLELPALPQNIFHPEGHSHASPKSLVQSLFHSSRIPPLRRNTNSSVSGPTVPEIRITIPSRATNDVDALLPRERRWSKVFEHDIDLAMSGMLDLRVGDHAIETYARIPPSARISATIRYPPSSIRTLPPPARRRLASPPHMTIDVRSGQIQRPHIPLCALSPIREARESWCSSTRSSMIVACDTIDEDKCASATIASIPEAGSGLMLAEVLAVPLPSCSLSSVASDSLGPRILGRASHGESISNFSQHTTSGVGLLSAVSQGRFVSADQPLAMASEVSVGPSLDAVTTSPAVSASPATKLSCESSTILQTSSTDSLSTPFTPDSRYFIARSPDTPDLGSSSYTASSSSVNPDTTSSPLPTSAIPSAYTCAIVPFSASSFANATSSLVTSSLSHYCTKLGERRCAGGSACDTVDRMGDQGSLHSLSGVELWVDEDIDLFYYPGPVETHTY